MVKRNGKSYIFVDTAGIRRKARIVDRLEKYSVIKSFQAIDRAQIVIVMLDSEEKVTDQDARIAGYAFEKDRGIILALNKWDLIKKTTTTINKYVESVRTSLKFLEYAPIVTISALEGTRAVKLFGLIDDLYGQFTKRVNTAELNKFLERVLANHPPGMHRTTKRIKMYYLTQIRTAPPTFMFFCNYPESLHFSYKRFLENQLRESFGFGSSPLKLVFRKRVGKAAEQDVRAKTHGKRTPRKDF